MNSSLLNNSSLTRSAVDRARRAMEEMREAARRAAEQRRHALEMARRARAETLARAARARALRTTTEAAERADAQRLPASKDPNARPARTVVPLEVDRDTTLASLVERRGASLEAVRRLNPQLRQMEDLRAGQSVLLPVSSGFQTCDPAVDPDCEESSGAEAWHNEGNSESWSSLFGRRVTEPDNPLASASYAALQVASGSTTQVGSPSASLVESSVAHRTNFLSMTGPNGGEVLTHTYAGQPPEVRAMMRAELKARGYTDMYLYVANDQDYGGPSFNYYDRPEEFAAILKELVDDGIRPVPWLIPDDSSGLRAEYPPERMKACWSRLIPAIDPYVSSYCLGLELNEYLPHNVEQGLGNHLNSLTDKPIFVHYTPGVSRSLAEPWVDGIIYQYGFGKNAAQIEEETRRVATLAHQLGKTFIAGEYALPGNEAEAKQLGQAALRGGADGFGNGG